MWGVLGSGFGLYGYLPALAAHASSPVLLPARYRSVMAARTDLVGYLAAAQFCDNDSEVLSRAGSVVIARRPEDASGCLDRILGNRDLKTVILEKPIGRTPDEGADIVDRLLSAGKTVDVAFLFRFAPWARVWRRALTGRGLGQPATLRWRFQAHHYRHDLMNWKRMHASGGGALRFYGIHVIALLAEWGFEQVEFSSVRLDPRGGVARWRALFVSPEMSAVLVDVDSSSEPAGFEVTGAQEFHFSADDPFEQIPENSGLPGCDRRAGYVLAMLRESRARASDACLRLHAINRLWRVVETVTALEVPDPEPCF